MYGYMAFAALIFMITPYSTHMTRSEIIYKKDTIWTNETACIDDTLVLVCPQDQLVVADDLMKFYDVNATGDQSECVLHESHCPDIFSSMPSDMSKCFWQKSDCSISIDVLTEQQMTCESQLVLATYFTAINFRCVPKNKVFEMCHAMNDNYSQPMGNVISPDFIGNYVEGDNCSLTIHSPPEYQCTRFSLQSVFFYIPDTASDGPCNESTDYLQITFYNNVGSNETHYFCGKDNNAISLSHTADYVVLFLQRGKGIQVEGFHIIFTAENTIDCDAPSTTVSTSTSSTNTTPAQELNTGAIIGIVALVLVFISIIITLIVVRVHKCQAKDLELNVSSNQIALTEVYERNFRSLERLEDNTNRTSPNQQNGTNTPFNEIECTCQNGRLNETSVQCINSSSLDQPHLTEFCCNKQIEDRIMDGSKHV